MTGPMTETLHNAAWAQCQAVRLSVLIPFYNDDPRPLITALTTTLPEGVEILALDDGRPDHALNSLVASAVNDLKSPCALLTSRINRGRSAARNRLAQASRGAWLLFLDADMVPGPDFITRWLLAMENTGADALFGGYKPGVPTSDTRVHACLAAASDPADAAERSRIGATAVCSSNLAARREVLHTIPFEESYAGWGWEDVDWALSAAQQFRLGHIDNPASHAGLETVDELLSKFARSGENFARLLQRHPDYAARPGAKLALLLQRFRLGWAARLAGSTAARLPLPAHLRVLGLKLYRAGVGAKAVKA
ncbi:MAG: glycosyltransferase [Alphaproteobacteria bacterium]|nr:glycosyltransferase [Alphaproteobacteria bacterium]